jgi:hypothetical protein
MTVGWKALEEYFLRLALVFQFNSDLSAVKVRKRVQSRQRPKMPVKKLRGAVNRAHRRKKNYLKKIT